MRAEKISIAGEIKEKVEGSIFVILADYKGLNMAKTTELKDKLLEVGARFQVVRNAAFGYAAPELSEKGLKNGLQGPSAMVYGSGDVVQVAKTLQEFIKANQLPVIKIGALEGTVISQAEIEELARLPGKDQLRGHLVATIAAPMTGLVGVFNQKLLSLLYVIKAIEEKKQQAA